jgi:DNA-binding MarR family transcriptional regulator
MQVGCETDGVADQAFLNHLESLQNWKKRTLPLLMMPQGEEVVTWLMCLGHRPRPLKDLYANSRFSEPTIRIVIQSLLDRKLVIFYSDESDQRVRLIRATKKLVQILDEYVSRIQCCPQAQGGRTLQ